tara:strand:+ start:467 stop:1615 length:1149 start_codon:yes stop_codon:yes gene_type:complete
VKIPFGKPLIGKEEISAVNKVLQSPILVHGPLANEFEDIFADFTGSEKAVSVSSCTAGMHLVYLSLGLGPGDEVIVPSQTHIATAHTVEVTGAKAVFVDSEMKTGNIDISLIEKHITSKTRAIAIVHYLGVAVDMVQINKIAKKYNLFVVEDCALAPGTYLDNCHAGLHGDVGVFSFYPVKHITSAEGGMVISKHNDLLKKISRIKAFGLDRNFLERKVPGLYDVKDLGINYRISELHAAVGIEQMKKLPYFLKQRKRNFEKLSTTLADINNTRVLPQLNDNRFKSSYYCLGLLLDDSIRYKREKIMKKLTARGIGTSIYYPSPLPRMTFYKDKYSYNPETYKNASTISDGIISFPVGPHLSELEMEFISKEFKEVMEELNV